MLSSVINRPELAMSESESLEESLPVVVKTDDSNEPRVKIADSSGLDARLLPADDPRGTSSSYRSSPPIKVWP